MFVLVCHRNIIDGSVTIVLDWESSLNQSASDWRLSVAQQSFDYLQVICSWIKLSPLNFQFQYVKGHQIDNLRYDQLDWWAKQNKDIDAAAKYIIQQRTTRFQNIRQQHVKSQLYLEK